jgi:hypothetical protein
MQTIPSSRRARIIGNPPVLKTGAFGLAGSSPVPSAISSSARSGRSLACAWGRFSGSRSCRARDGRRVKRLRAAALGTEAHCQFRNIGPSVLPQPLRAGTAQGTLLFVHGQDPCVRVLYFATLLRTTSYCTMRFAWAQPLVYTQKPARKPVGRAYSRAGKAGYVHTAREYARPPTLRVVYVLFKRGSA